MSVIIVVVVIVEMVVIVEIVSVAVVKERAGLTNVNSRYSVQSCG